MQDVEIKMKIKGMNIFFAEHNLCLYIVTKIQLYIYIYIYVLCIKYRYATLCDVIVILLL